MCELGESARAEGGAKRTVAVVMEVEKLVVPLCYYSQRILDEGDDDEEATDCGEVTGLRQAMSAHHG